MLENHLLDLSQRNPFKMCQATDQLETALLPFREGIHRVAVVDQGSLVGVLSQADVINWIAENPNETKNLDIPIKHARWKSDSVLYTSSQTSAIDTFLRMWESRVSSIGVVQHGQLQLILSASDIKVERGCHLLTMTGKCALDNDLVRCEWLLEPVGDFLARVHHLKNRPADFLITCTQNSKLSEVIQLLKSERIHRIFICDNLNRPVGVMTLTDIIRDVTFEVEAAT